MKSFGKGANTGRKLQQKKKHTQLRIVYNSPVQIKWDALGEQQASLVLEVVKQHYLTVHAKDLVKGINQVSKGLEKQQLSLVILCKPKHLSHSLLSHIPVQCATTHTPMIALRLCSFLLGKPFGIPKALSIGIIKDSSLSHLLLPLLTCHTTEISIPWLVTDIHYIPLQERNGTEEPPRKCTDP